MAIYLLLLLHHHKELHKVSHLRIDFEILMHVSVSVYELLD